MLRKDAEVLKGAVIKQHPFVHTPIVREDFYYLDPPYHQTYDGYNGNGFDDEEHKKLAQFCKELDKAKAQFMLSNSDTPLVRSLYASYHIEVVQASRSVSCKGDQRGKEHELIIRNYQ